MASKLWEKDFEINSEIERFTVGRDREMDLYLAPDDVLGSMAHITMLESIGLLTSEELSQLLAALKEIYALCQRGEFVIEEGVEDVHSQVELMLTRQLGDMGKKIHSGRSRNDQVLVDLKLFTRQQLKDIAEEVSQLLEHTDFDPAELENINNRLDQLYSLEKKYHVESIHELISLRDDLKEKLSNIENSDEAVSDLEKEVSRLKNLCTQHAEAISKKRRATAQHMRTQLAQRLEALGMPHARFDISITQTELGKNGQDNVAFLFSANTSTPLQPVSQVASGGEIARVMLSLKAMISGAVKLPTIIFDEIDTGVSGKIAEKMAQIMQEMGRTERQVISITHLPQIAALGSHHYRGSKEETKDGTVSHMTELNNEERITEIAQMLSGSNISKEAIANAKQLLK